MSLLRSSVTVGSFTLLSRIFGFLRDVVIANHLGAGMLSDAFFVAFKIPNFLRRLFAEGAFNAAFLPTFAGLLKVDGEKTALAFASTIMTSLAICLAIITSLAIFFMPEILSVIAPGYNDNPKLQQLTASLSRITFPYLLFISLVSLLGGILNSYDRFAAVAFTPVLLNISLISFLLFLSPLFESYAHALSSGVLFAGFLQCAWLYYVVWRHGTMPVLVRPHMTDNVRKMLKAFIPVAFGAGVAQVNQLIDVILATYLDNAVSYLYYADRIYELPLGVIGIAVATALLPMLSRHIRAKEHQEASQAIEQALRFVTLIGIPAAAALVVIAEPIIRTIYQHGEFSASDSEEVLPALIAYSYGLPAFLMIKIFSNCFFAAADTKTPVKIAIFAMATNLALNLVLIQYYAHVGLAIATSVAGWLNASLLFYFLHKRHIFRPSRKLLIYIGKIVLSAAGMVILLSLTQQTLQGFTMEHTIERAFITFLLIIVGASSYFVFAFLLKALSIKELSSWVRKS